MMQKPSSRSYTVEEVTFIKCVWDYYQAHGRHDLPWRKTHNPYRILVSEIMLQQTQVARVIPKYREFLHDFPSTKALAWAPLEDVLRVWQGLGYNRRAKYLKAAATLVHIEQHGHWPRSAANLARLPGIGPYTAGAVAAFAYNEPVPIIETNIRTVYFHHFFRGIHNVSDVEILELVRATLDQTRPREWYYALMDYGSYLKQMIGNTNHQSRHYTKQSPFKGSNRAVRGAILRQLLTAPGTVVTLAPCAFGDQVRLEVVLDGLIKDGLITKRARRYYIA